MRSHVMGCAICSGYYFVIDVSGNLWKGTVSQPKETPRILEEELPQITSVVACNGSGMLILLDIDGMIWYEVNDHSKKQKKGTEFKQIKGIDGIKSVAVASLEMHNIIFALNFEGVLYEISDPLSYQQVKINKIENLPPIEYISGFFAIAAKDFNNEIWYKSSFAKPFEKIPLAGNYASDLIVEHKSVKFIGSDGNIWKYPQSEDNLKAFLLFDEFPKFQILYGSGNHGFALDVNNDLWGWGNNNNGQIHDAIHETRFYSPRKLPSEHRWKYIYCAARASIMISEEGEVFLRCQGSIFKIPGIEQAFIGKAPAKSARK